MSWVAVAVGAGSAIAGIVGANKASSSARDAQRGADRAQREATALQKEQLAFEKQRYNEWKSVYGDVQERLSKYYTSLTPDAFATQGLQSFQEQYQRMQEQVAVGLAQRGITDSGLAANVDMQMAMQAAQQRAQIVFDAPQAVAERQSQFLQIGLGQNPANNLSAAMQSSANQQMMVQQQATQQAAQFQQISAASMQAGMEGAGTALSTYLRHKG